MRSPIRKPLSGLPNVLISSTKSALQKFSSKKLTLSTRFTTISPEVSTNLRRRAEMWRAQTANSLSNPLSGLSRRHHSHYHKTTGRIRSLLVPPTTTKEKKQNAYCLFAEACLGCATYSGVNPCCSFPNSNHYRNDSRCSNRSQRRNSSWRDCRDQEP